jgi:RNA polymerase sigma-70 factor (ECF subfamily)
VGNRFEAEDAVQEAFERSYRSLANFGADYRLRAWLSRIVANVCADHGARRIAETRMCEQLVGHDVPGEDAFEGISDPTVLGAVKSALAALPGSQRRCFLLREVGGLSYPEVADEVGISEDNARARVHRAKSTLRRSLHDVRGTLGALLGLPSGYRYLVHRSSRGTTGTGRMAARASDALPVSSPSFVPVVSPFAGQVAVQMAGPLGQVAAVAAPLVTRGSLAAGLALGLASTLTGLSPGAAAAPQQVQPSTMRAVTTADVGTAPASVPATGSGRFHGARSIPISMTRTRAGSSGMVCSK